MKIEDTSEEELLNHIEDVDLLDFEEIEDGCLLFTDSNQLFNTKKYFESQGLQTKNEEIIMDPVTHADVSLEIRDKIISLSSKIEELDDVQNVFMNINVN